MVTRVAVETRRQLHYVKNDNKRVRVICRGDTPQFNNPFTGCPSPARDPTVVGGPSVGEGPSAGQTFKNNEVGGKDKVCNKSNKGEPQVVVEATCPWALQISKGVRDATWTMRTFRGIHKCLQTKFPKKYTSFFLAKTLEDTNPDIPVKALMDQLPKKYEVGISYMKTTTAKAMALEKIRGNYKHQYNMLRDYILEVPGTDPNLSTRQLRRIYFCLGAFKKGFKACSRELLGLDGTHMRGPFPGQFLTAVGIDGNTGTYPVAYAHVEDETKDSWTWFLECLGEDLGLNSNSIFTFISDRQKGLVPAVSTTFPCAEHRYCVSHIHDNMKGTWRGEKYKELLWKCATATTVPYFNIAMKEVRAENKELKNIPPRHWSRSHFESPRVVCDVLLNNLCEVFNRKLLDRRDKPVITTLEFVREYLMRRIELVQKVIDRSDGPLTLAATRMFQTIKKEVSK